MSAFAAALILLSVIQQEIVVTAARDEQPRDQASAALTVIDREDLARLPASSLSEVLGLVPGVTMMFESGASGQPMISSRGFFGGGEVEYVKLLVDGVPVGDAESGIADWQRFRTTGIDRVEVLHGPGSALYGDTALGGVIQVFTADDRGEVHAAAGSFDMRELAARFSTELANGFRVDGRAGEWASNGYRDHSEAEGREGEVAVESLGDRSRWRLNAAAGRQRREQPGALTRDAIAEDREQSDPLFGEDEQTTTRTRVGAAFDSFGATPVRATLYAVRRDDDNLRTLLLVPGFGSSAFRALTTDVAGGTLEVSREWERAVLRAGTDLERASLSASYAESNAAEEGDRDRIGLFVTGAFTIAERYHLTAGLRRDEIRDDVVSTTSGKRTASAWSPRVGLNVHLGPETSPLSLFAQVSNAFKAPTLDQLFDPRPYPDGMGGTFTVSNPDLRPQRARNLEAGLSRNTPSSDWSLAAYRMNVRDEIDFDPQTYSYRNIGRSLHRGVEASVAVAKTARVSPRLTYAWTHVEDVESPGVQLKNIPEHTAQLMVHWRLAAATRADAIYRWRGGLTLDDAGTFREPSVSRVDLRLSHDIRGVRVEADMLNALDARYNELGYVLLDFTGQPVALEYPAPGRAVRLGVTWTLAKKPF